VSWGGQGVTPTTNWKKVQDISAKFRCEVARNGEVNKSEFYPPKFWEWGRVLPKLQRGNRQQNIAWKIHLDQSSQTSVACRRSSKTVQWPGKLDFSPCWTTRQIWPELDTKLKRGSFLDWAIAYKNAENGLDGIVTEVAKWRQSGHFTPKSAALTGGWGPENA